MADSWVRLSGAFCQIGGEGQATTSIARFHAQHSAHPPHPTPLIHNGASSSDLVPSQPSPSRSESFLDVPAECSFAFFGVGDRDDRLCSFGHFSACETRSRTRSEEPSRIAPTPPRLHPPPVDASPTDASPLSPPFSLLRLISSTSSSPRRRLPRKCSSNTMRWGYGE